MDKIFSYTAGSVIHIEPQTNQRVAIQSSRDHAAVIDLQYPVIEPYARLVGRWIVECKNNSILLRENDTSIQDDRIVISFQQPDITVHLKYSSDARSENMQLQKVRRIDIYPREVGKVKVQINEQSNATENSNPIPIPEPDPSGIERLKTELEREKNTSKQLQEIIANRLEDIISTASGNNNALSEDNKAKLQTVITLNEEADQLAQEEQGINSQIDEINSRIDDLRDQILSRRNEESRLREQLEELNSQKELVDLDCDAASAQLDEIKQHLSLDTNTLKLLEDGYRLKHGTISKALAEMEKELVKVEKRIAFILEFRSKFNQVVEDSIFNGDGTILTSDETGGNSDGI